MGNSDKFRFHQLEHESKMRLLKPHSHTSNRPGYEARKTPKKKLKETQTLEEGKPSVKTCRVPQVWRGGETKKALWQDQPPS